MANSRSHSSGSQKYSEAEETVDQVHYLIERCLVLYMTRKEILECLSDRAQVETSITEIVLERLEKENPEFFKAYYTRLMLKDQIMQFNVLLEKQVHYMRHTHPNLAPSAPPFNESLLEHNSLRQVHSDGSTPCKGIQQMASSGVVASITASSESLPQCNVMISTQEVHETLQRSESQSQKLNHDQIQKTESSRHKKRRPYSKRKEKSQI